MKNFIVLFFLIAGHCAQNLSSQVTPPSEVQDSLKRRIGTYSPSNHKIFNDSGQQIGGVYSTGSGPRDQQVAWIFDVSRQVRLDDISFQIVPISRHLSPSGYIIRLNFDFKP